MRTRILTLALTLLLTLSAAGCSEADAPTVQEPEEQPIRLGTIVFDMGHGEIFGADDTSELGQSEAIARMRAAGYDVIVNPDTLDVADLEGASGLVIAGPMRPLADDEYAAVTSFVEAGGTVLLTIHVPYPVLKVPAHWGLPVDTRIMMSQSPAFRPEQPSVFSADVIAESPLTEGVKSIIVVSGWPVTPVIPEAQLLVSSRPDTWLTEAGDQQPVPPADAQFASCGVVGVANIGKGRVIVSGDDAIFANLAINEADNARLLDNIIGLMTAAMEI